MSEAVAWTASPEQLEHVNPAPGEYVATVAFVREYADDSDILGAPDGATLEQLAIQLNRELQQVSDEQALPAGRWQVLRVEPPVGSADG